MIYIKHENGVVYYTHRKPFHTVEGLGKSREELEVDGLFVSEIPEHENIEGKVEVMMINLETNEIYYEYIDFLPSQEDLTQQKIQSLEEENADLLFKSAMAEMKVEGLENDVAELMFKVANIEMGGVL